MNAGSCNIEIFSGKRRPLRDMVPDFFFVILCKLGDDGSIHAVQIPLKLRILKYHCLQRRIAGALPDTK